MQLVIFDNAIVKYNWGSVCRYEFTKPFLSIQQCCLFNSKNDI